MKIGDYVYVIDPDEKAKPYIVGIVEKIEGSKLYCNWSGYLKSLPALEDLQKLMEKGFNTWIYEGYVLPLEFKVEKRNSLDEEDINAIRLMTPEAISLITKQIMDIDNYDSTTLMNLEGLEKIDIDKIIQMLIPNVIKIMTKIPA